MAARQHRFSATRFSLLAAALGGAVALGCGDADSDSDADADAEGDTPEEIAEARLALTPLQEGRRLFEQETFGGNGRTCAHCHRRRSGTISPEDVQEVFFQDPDHPLFLLDGSDDFQGNGATRILEHATILVRRRLPAAVHLADDPTATSIIVRRGVPTTLDTPALDPVLMLDGRAPDLAAQARGAIFGHAQATIPPTPEEVELLTEYEKSRKFFSSDALEDYAQGGPAPALPPGKTPAQKRGRKWFEDTPVGPAVRPDTPRNGLCATCHSGPLLNRTNGLLTLPFPGAPAAGERFQSSLVAELNTIGNPVLDFVVLNPDGTESTVSTPDPGRALVTGNFAPPPAGQLSQFKIPILRGLKKTAPYFHDNSAKTLTDVVDHYAQFFAIVTAADVDGDPPLVMTAQDRADLRAYLELL